MSVPFSVKPQSPGWSQVPVRVTVRSDTVGVKVAGGRGGGWGASGGGGG